MNATQVKPEILHTYGCAVGHKVYRKAASAAPCSRCGAPMEYIGSTERRCDETEVDHHVRALALKMEVSH